MVKKRNISKIGDVYEVPLPDGKKGYVQYIADDLTQIGSNVIRVFKKRYQQEMQLDLRAILKGEVDFYCHVTGMGFGEDDGSWKKIGYSVDVGDLKAALFRDYADPEVRRENGFYGMPKISKTWSIWRINEPRKYVNKLTGENIKADIGIVTWPEFVVYQMKTGKRYGFYPDYK